MTIKEAFQDHLDGLIRGWELWESEAAHWVDLLGTALGESDPVQKANYYGFESVSSIQDIYEALAYLAPIAAGNN